MRETRDGKEVSGPALRRSGPWVPLAATLAMQTLATMAAYSMAAAAPEIGPGLGIEPALVGVFISFVYGVGMVSALFSPSAIRRFGAARTGQFVMLATAGMLVAAASGNLAIVAASAVILGLGYGATAPVATHLIVPRTRPGQLNLILSIRQIGVPLGGTLAGLLVPPLVLGLGWETALLVQVVPALALLALLQAPRARWDADRAPLARLRLRGALVPLRLLRTDRAVRNLTFATFLYAGIQLCFVAFLVVHLASGGVADLVRAGQALAVFQVSGVVSRPIWGVIADRWTGARALLVLHGVVMAGAAVAAGRFSPDWSFPAVLLVCVVAGTTASGFTGIAYGELARIGGERRTEVTALGSAAMFLGVVVLPSVFGIVVAAGGGYPLAYAGAAALAIVGALALAAPRPRIAGILDPDRVDERN